MKKPVLMTMVLVLSSQVAMAESLLCQTADEKIKIELQVSNTDVANPRVMGLESENSDMMFASTERSRDSLKVTMIDMMNARGLELAVEAKDGKFAGTLVDMGAAGNASTEYAVSCVVE